MKNVKVLGPGCSRCMRTADMVQAEADRLGIPVAIETVTDYAAIASYGVAATLMHAGGLPRAADIEKWLTAEPS